MSSAPTDCEAFGLRQLTACRGQTQSVAVSWICSLYLSIAVARYARWLFRRYPKAQTKAAYIVHRRGSWIFGQNMGSQTAMRMGCITFLVRIRCLILELQKQVIDNFGTFTPTSHELENSRFEHGRTLQSSYSGLVEQVIPSKVATCSKNKWRFGQYMSISHGNKLRRQASQRAVSNT